MRRLAAVIAIVVGLTTAAAIVSDLPSPRIARSTCSPPLAQDAAPVGRYA